MAGARARSINEVFADNENISSLSFVSFVRDKNPLWKQNAMICAIL